MVKLRLSIGLLVAAVLLALGCEHGPPPTIARPVNDYADALSAGDEEALARTLIDHRERTGVQIALLVIHTTDGEPIEDYANRTARAWGGGQRGRDNGVLVILALDDHRSRIEVGSGVQGLLTDGYTRRLQEDQHPALRRHDVAGALRGIVDGLVYRTTDLHLTPAPEPIPVLCAAGLGGVFVLVLWWQRQDRRRELARTLRWQEQRRMEDERAREELRDRREESARRQREEDARREDAAWQQRERARVEHAAREAKEGARREALAAVLAEPLADANTPSAAPRSWATRSTTTTAPKSVNPGTVAAASVVAESLARAQREALAKQAEEARERVRREEEAARARKRREEEEERAERKRRKAEEEARRRDVDYSFDYSSSGSSSSSSSDSSSSSGSSSSWDWGSSSSSNDSGWSGGGGGFDGGGSSSSW